MHRPIGPVERLAVLFAITAAMFAGLSAVRFHPDESHWIGLSAPFEAFFTGRVLDPSWQTREDRYMMAPMTYYVVGVARRLGGWTPDALNKPYDFNRSYSQNLADGRVPVPDLLEWGRRGVTASAVIGLYLSFIVFARAAGRPAAYVWRGPAGRLRTHIVRRTEMRVMGWQRVVVSFACAAAASPFADGGVARAAQDPGVTQQQASQPARDERALGTERTLAVSVKETRMVETVKRLVAFGPRQYGTPSNHEAAAWLSSAFREAGLEVTVREDPPRNWYQPVSWEIRATADSPGATGIVLRTTWPSSGAPSGTGSGALSLVTSPGAVCLTSANPTPESTAGCAAVLVDGRASASGWPVVNRLRGTWTVPVFAVSPSETAPLREQLAASGKVQVAFALEAKSGNSGAQTVVATLPGRDRSKYILFCAHGDSDSGGPGANDNASGVAIVLEVARTLAAAVRSGAIPPPAWDLRFASWGGEISSTREYLAAMDKDAARLQAVFNYDQSGFGSSKDALYVEPDDVPANREIVTLVRAVMTDHIGTQGFPEHAASIKSQGGTDSYVFQPRAQGATVYPSVTLYTSAWDRERAVPVTEGFPPIKWYAGEQPGMVTVDGDAFYHSVGDTPANTTDTEPSNMGWCARVGLLSALRMMAVR